MTPRALSLTGPKSAKVTWLPLTTVRSESEPGETYLLKRRLSDGHIGCACLSYRFAKREAKTCKHIEANRAAFETGEVQAERVQHTEYKVHYRGDVFTFGRAMELPEAE